MNVSSKGIRAESGWQIRKKQKKHAVVKMVLFFMEISFKRAISSIVPVTSSNEIPYRRDWMLKGRLVINVRTNASKTRTDVAAKRQIASPLQDNWLCENSRAH